MTQEEKAKHYDDAVRKAKAIIKNYSKDKASLTVIEHIFPELKEGEDERIKKEILELVSISGNGNQFEEIKDWLEKQCENQKLDGTFVNIDDVREDFMNQIYSILDEDATNDRANLIIEAFDNLPSITISNQYSQILANSAKICEDKQQVEIDKEYKIGKWFTGLIPCWIDAPSTLQAAHNHHGENIVAIHLKDGGYRCCCIDDKEPITFSLAENTPLVEGWHNRENN